MDPGVLMGLILVTPIVLGHMDRMEIGHIVHMDLITLVMLQELKKTKRMIPTTYLPLNMWPIEDGIYIIVHGDGIGQTRQEMLT